ncbi:hypothetical protein GCK32_015971 [Trichostrongylus colubriformis]|uniref:Malic enzyme NAD-binding domain-containing protein n=1 Tax=Trichostrongylus colubriformis TaxID=6319 RepID=A0AAN8FC65_TRICO
MMDEGLSDKEACDRIFMMDVGGLITKARGRSLTDRHMRFAKEMDNTKSLIEVIRTVKPEALIGASTVGGAFTEEIIREMAKINKRPIIFALSNPTTKAECTAEDAYRLTDRCAESVTVKSLEKYSRLYPRLKHIRELSVYIAIDVGNFFYENNLATLHPEPEDKEMFVRSQIYSVEYDELINKTYDWPAKDAKHGFPVPVLPRSSMDDE